MTAGATGTSALAAARERKLNAQEALRISELEVSLCKWQRRLSDMEQRLFNCEQSEAQLLGGEESPAAYAAAAAQDLGARSQAAQHSPLGSQHYSAAAALNPKRVMSPLGDRQMLRSDSPHYQRGEQSPALGIDLCGIEAAVHEAASHAAAAQELAHGAAAAAVREAAEAAAREAVRQVRIAPCCGSLAAAPFCGSLAAAPFCATA